MAQTLTIAQVSDIHIGATANPQSGVDMRQQFQAVLRLLRQRPLDLLVLSGDLALVAGEPEAYRWIQQQLVDFPCPYLVMTGNHDNLDNLVEIFAIPASDLQQKMLCFSRYINGRYLIFLDTLSYALPEAQQHWLAQQLANIKEEVLVFMHHPPILCDCVFMDSRYSLQNIDEVWPILANAPNVKHVFCGHYHTERDITLAGTEVHVTPSTMLQIDTETREFKIASRVPGWRIIEWPVQGAVRTYVEYLTTE
jgi:Icc protein